MITVLMPVLLPSAKAVKGRRNSKICSVQIVFCFCFIDLKLTIHEMTLGGKKSTDDSFSHLKTLSWSFKPPTKDFTKIGDHTGSLFTRLQPDLFTLIRSRYDTVWMKRGGRLAIDHERATRLKQHSRFSTNFGDF